MARTLQNSVSVQGVGIHTGADARVTLAPFPPGAGIHFVRDGILLPARANAVVETVRCTVLGQGDVTVSTVEHLMSAFAALGVTDARVNVAGPELPIGDGSASLWVDAVNEAGLTDSTDDAPRFTLTEPLVLTGKGGAFIAAYPSDRLTVTVNVHFDHPQVGTQVARFVDGGDYAVEIAPARTFGFIEEVEALIAAGLARGGSFDNAVVVYPDRTSTPLRFADEFARHKLLDLLGDLYLAGALPQADIIAVKPSHRLNTAFAAHLAERHARR